EMGDLYHVAAAARVNQDVEVKFVTGDRNGTNPTARPEDTMLRFVDERQVTTEDVRSDDRLQEIRAQNDNPVKATEVVTDAIRGGTLDQRREMPLGLEDGQSQAVRDFLDRKLADLGDEPFVAYWNRSGDYQRARNGTQADLDSFHQTASDAGVRVVVLGPDHL